MAFHVYVLRSQSTGRFYVGHTENLGRRISAHNNNRTASIKNRGPWEFATRQRGVEAGTRNQGDEEPILH
jgi:putative endonuclease